MTKTPSAVATSIPQKTAVPMTLRDAAPEPDASIRGTTPRMKANAVMRIGRKRSRAASSPASRAVAPWSRFIFANSTMRIEFFAASPISISRPICTKTLFVNPPR